MIRALFVIYMLSAVCFLSSCHSPHDNTAKKDADLLGFKPEHFHNISDSVNIYVHIDSYKFGIFCRIAIENKDRAIIRVRRWPILVMWGPKDKKKGMHFLQPAAGNPDLVTLGPGEIFIKKIKLGENLLGDGRYLIEVMTEFKDEGEFTVEKYFEVKNGAVLNEAD